ncbi:hypothetical protein DFH07DRAFT_775336 [Mycena maculata]|uniref:Uncharacterized protein n=1 Tax=Mycena maculata TaxID=230809 RepID=A0AAD7N7Z0_9AGAR|nr:hypothetical protein DFH07DRAFT_775336 [Mycena maculata]
MSEGGARGGGEAAEVVVGGGRGRRMRPHWRKRVSSEAAECYGEGCRRTRQKVVMKAVVRGSEGRGEGHCLPRVLNRSPVPKVSSTAQSLMIGEGSREFLIAQTSPRFAGVVLLPLGPRGSSIVFCTVNLAFCGQSSIVPPPPPAIPPQTANVIRQLANIPPAKLITLLQFFQGLQAYPLQYDNSSRIREGLCPLFTRPETLHTLTEWWASSRTRRLSPRWTQGSVWQSWGIRWIYVRGRGWGACGDQHNDPDKLKLDTEFRLLAPRTSELKNSTEKTDKFCFNVHTCKQAQQTHTYRWLPARNPHDRGPKLRCHDGPARLRMQIPSSFNVVGWGLGRGNILSDSLNPGGGSELNATCLTYVATYNTDVF